MTPSTLQNKIRWKLVRENHIRHASSVQKAQWSFRTRFLEVCLNLFNALKLKFQDANCAFSLFHSHCLAFFVAFQHSIDNYTVCIVGFVVSLELFCLNKYFAFVLITNGCNFRCVISRNCY